MFNRSRTTVADIRALRNERQLTMLRVESLEEAEAANQASIDMASVPETLVRHPAFRDAAPDLFSIVGEDFWTAGHGDDYIRWAYRVYGAGADAVYCAAAPATIKRMADDGVPICGHIGLIPQRMTWTGGLKAVGKDLASAKQVWSQMRSLEVAGAFAAEVEVVPVGIARLLTERSNLVMISMGAGDGCHGQYLYACDVLGETTGRIPRHAKVYRDFAGERERLQRERVSAFEEFRDDVTGGRFPEGPQTVAADPDVVTVFQEFLAESDGEK